MLKNKKILLLSVSTLSHINAIIEVAKELNNRDARVIFMAKKEFRDKIENAGLEFKEYPYMDPELDPPRSFVTLHQTVDVFLNVAKSWLPHIIKIVEDEQPDLIFSDYYNFFAKYLIKHMKYRYKKRKSKIAPPPFIEYIPTFVVKEDKYPNTRLADKLKINPKKDFEFLSNYPRLLFKQAKLNWKYDGIRVIDPVRFMFKSKTKLKIVTVIPELQPKINIFDSSFKFVGCCLTKERKEETIDSQMVAFLERFKPINPVQNISDIDQKQAKLIYVSMGSVLHNSFIFDRILEAISDINSHANNSNKFYFILAVNYIIYDQLQKRFTRDNFKLDENVLIVKLAPQIEILKRASLFITHAGMNSTSEAIHYGVPTVCIPICYDQPLVAYRICDDLKLGVRLTLSNLTSIQVKQAIFEVLNNIKYAENMIELSKISHKSNGTGTAVELIENFFNQS